MLKIDFCVSCRKQTLEEDFEIMEGSLSPDLQQDCETDMKFEQRGVCQKFSVNGKRRKETILIPGNLSITENVS